MIKRTNRTAGSVHSLSTLESLSSGRDFLVSLSERTLYLLANFASDDVTFLSRYAVGDVGQTYQPLDPDSDLYGLYFDIVEAFQIEVTDYMSTTQAIDALTQAVLSLQTAVLNGGSCCAGVPGSQVPLLDDFNGTQDPPTGYVAPLPVLDYPCSMANVYYQAMDDLMGDLIAVGFQNQTALGATILGLIFGEVLSRQKGLAGWIFETLGLLSDAVVLFLTYEFDLSELRTLWQANKQDIICAVYNASGSYAKATAVNDLVESWVTLDGNKRFVYLINSANAMVSQYYTPETQQQAYQDQIDNLPAPVDCAACAPTLGFVFAPNRGDGVAGNNLINTEPIGTTVRLYAQLNPNNNQYELQFSRYTDGNPPPGLCADTDYLFSLNVLSVGGGGPGFKRRITCSPYIDTTSFGTTGLYNDCLFVVMTHPSNAFYLDLQVVSVA